MSDNDLTLEAQELYDEFFELGHDAFFKGEAKAPWSNEGVQAWTKFVDPKVGDPRSKAVLKGFSDGWEQAAFDEIAG